MPIENLPNEYDTPGGKSLSLCTHTEKREAGFGCFTRVGVGCMSGLNFSVCCKHGCFFMKPLTYTWFTLLDGELFG